MPDRIIKQAREYLGFTRDQVAIHLGISVAAIDAIESGSVRPADDQLFRFSRLYGREPADLLRAGPDDVSFGPKPTSLEVLSGRFPIEDRVELAMFARFLRNRRILDNPPDPIP